MMPAKANQADKPATRDADLPRQIELGFMFSHSVMSETSRRMLAASTAVFALADLLVEKGLIDEDALKTRRDEVETVLRKQAEESGIGMFLNDRDTDKYALAELPQINCAERLPLCRGACCALPFPLSRQDVEEGIVRFDVGRPYWNLRDRTGYCVHHDTNTRRCQVYGARPGPCRLYDCRHDPRIWSDFDAMVVNPKLDEMLEARREPRAVRRDSADLG